MVISLSTSCRIGQGFGLTSDTVSRGVRYCADDDLAFEGAEYDQTELNYTKCILALEYASNQILRDVTNCPTVDIDIATPMTNEAV
jgi:hypothetical protein